jgi:hypothetical protein
MHGRMLRIVRLLALTFAYGLLFHGLTRLCAILLGRAEIDPAALIHRRDLAYSLLSSIVAAAACTAAWRWRYRSFALRDAFAAGAMSVALIVVNLVVARGFGGLTTMFAANPVHPSLKLLIAFLAPPLCALAADALPGPTKGVSRSPRTPPGA